MVEARPDRTGALAGGAAQTTPLKGDLPATKRERTASQAAQRRTPEGLTGRERTLPPTRRNVRRAARARKLAGLRYAGGAQ